MNEQTAANSEKERKKDEKKLLKLQLDSGGPIDDCTNRRGWVWRTPADKRELSEVELVQEIIIRGIFTFIFILNFKKRI